LAVFRQTVQDSDELNRALLSCSQELTKAGYHAQVRVNEKTSLLFAMVNGRRAPLRRKNGEFVLEDAQPVAPGQPGAGQVRGQRLSSREVLSWVERAAGDFSPNVLLRPILQDTLLPTVAYVGGPAEAAYFAQAHTLYERMLRRMPVFVPRSSFTLVEPRVARLLRKYGLSLEDAFRGQQHLERAIATARLPRQLKLNLARAAKKMGDSLDGLSGGLEKLDPTLLGALANGRKKILYQLEKLKTKAARAEADRAEVARRHTRMLQSALYPHHALQERVISFLPFLGRYGRGILEQLIGLVMLRGGDHQVIHL
jgi:bacillithiol biosynthesis cysteine-adding enzyme BshC